MEEEQLAPGFPTVLGHIPLQDLLRSALHSLRDISVLPPPCYLTKAFPPCCTGTSTSMCVPSLLSPLGDTWPMEILARVKGEPASDENLEHTRGCSKAQASMTRMTGPSAIPIFCTFGWCCTHLTPQIQDSGCNRSLLAGDRVCLGLQKHSPHLKLKEAE